MTSYNDRLRDSVLEDKNLAFDFKTYLETLNKNITAQRKLVEVECSPSTSSADTQP